MQTKAVCLFEMSGNHSHIDASYPRLPESSEIAVTTWNARNYDDDLANKVFVYVKSAPVSKHVSLITLIHERCVEAHRCVLKGAVSWATSWWALRIAALCRWHVPAEMWQRREIWATYPRITFRISQVVAVNHWFEAHLGRTREFIPDRIPAVLNVTSLKLFMHFREALHY